MKTALLLVDIQNDYFPGGCMELDGMNEAGSRAQELLGLFRQNAWPVFHIQHIAARPGATFFLPGTNGAEIHVCLKPLENEVVITKHFPNSFRGTLLLDLVKDAGIHQLVICGAMSHMCIDATTRAAFDLGFGCTLIHDACATRELVFEGRTISAWEVQASFMAALASAYADVRSSGEFKSGITGG